jgi:hypothetical protein
LAFHRQIGADPDPAYYFDADPDLEFNWMRIHADTDPHSTTLIKSAQSAKKVVIVYNNAGT